MDDTPPSPASASPLPPVTIGARAKLGYLLAILVFAGSAFVAVQSGRIVTEKGEEVARIVEFLGTLRETFSLIQDMETGQRGYIITKQPSYLTPYDAALKELHESLTELERRNGLLADRGDWYPQFAKLVAEKREELKRTVAQLQANPDAPVELDAGKRYMDAIRAAVTERQERDLAQLRSARDQVIDSLARAVTTGVAAAVLGVGIVGVSFYRIRSALTVQQRLAKALLVQREALRVTLMSIGDGVITTDPLGRVVALNGVAEQFTGWPQHDAQGQALERVFQIVNETSRETVDNPALRALREGVVVGLANHTVLIARDGRERAIDDSAAPIRSDDGTLLGAVLVFRDVTEQRRAQAEILEGQRRKDEFLAMLGHELRNPLAGILTGVQVLRMLRAEGDAARMQEVIERQAAHMSRMVDDLLDISRFARGKLTLRLEDLDLRELLRVTVEDYRNSQLVENCELALSLPDAEVWVRGDRTRLAQAVSNLIHNGCKFCDGPNTISVGLTVDASAGTAAVTVADRGIGMDKATLAQVFQPFIQADTSIERSRGGLGLGLALVNGIAKLHGGEVSAASDGLGRGSRFTIRVPIITKPITVSTVPTAPPQGVQRVLIIDDRRDAVIPLRKMMLMDGHEVESATNGVDGIAAAKAIRPTIVLCDIGLADGMNGYEVAKALRATPELSATYLVAVTGYGQEDDRQQAQQAGFDFHVMKPVGKQTLQELLRDMPRFH